MLYNFYIGTRSNKMLNHRRQSKKIAHKYGFQTNNLIIQLKHQTNFINLSTVI